MRKLTVTAGLLAVLATGWLSVACGATSGQLPAAWSSPPPAALKIALGSVRDTEYGFTMAYPTGWLRSTWQKESGSSSASTVQFLLSYADPKGAQVGGIYVDGEQVAVHLLGKSVAPGEVSHDVASRIVRGVMLKGLPGLGFRSELRKVDVHGDAGWLQDYSYSIGTKTIWARSILVFKGKHAYWATGQASSMTWNSVYPRLVMALSRFRVD